MGPASDPLLYTPKLYLGPSFYDADAQLQLYLYNRECEQNLVPLEERMDFEEGLCRLSDAFREIGVPLVVLKDPDALYAAMRCARPHGRDMPASSRELAQRVKQLTDEVTTEYDGIGVNWL